MKRLTSLLLALALCLGLAACGSNNAAVTAEPTAAPTTEPTAEPVENAPIETAPAETEPPAEGGVLVAYFSWSGNTEVLAGMIQERTGGDLFEIRPETAYTDNYNELLDIARAEQNEGARPALAELPENVEDYDTIFVGYPNWWGGAPMVILSFIESFDCSGKTIIPFCTSGGGGLGHGPESIAESAEGATVEEGFHVSGSSVSGAEAAVSDWLGGLGF